MSRFKPYPEYKDSGVEWLGEVPTGWDVLPLKRLAILNPGKSALNVDRQQLCSFVPMEKLLAGQVLLDEERPIDTVFDGYTYFEDGDVLQAKVTPCFENGNVALAVGLKNGIGFGSTEINVLRPHGSINSRYLFYRVQEDAYMRVCTASMLGAGGLKRVPTDTLNNFKIAAPSEEEQTQIARFLDHETARIDALIAEQERLIDLLKEKRQAVISHAVTKGLNPDAPMRDSGVEWMGEVPAHWIVLQLKLATLSMQTGPFGSQLHASEYVEGGIPVINPAHMIDSVIIPDSQITVDERTWKRLERHALTENDIVVARRGELGRCAVVTDAQSGWLCGTGSLKVTLNERLDAHYAYLLITSKGVVAELALESKGSTMENLNTETFGRIRLPVPPAAEQKSILNYVHDLAGQFGTLIAEAESAIKLMAERRSALISAAVTGKIDVRYWQPPTDVDTPSTNKTITTKEPA